MKKNTQNTQMQNSYYRVLMGNFLFVTLGWFSILTFLGTSDWKTGFVWIILETTLFVFLTLYKQYFKHAYEFYFSLFILVLPNSFLLFDAATRLIVAATKLNKQTFFIFFLTNMLLIIVGLFFQTQTMRARLQASVLQNISSGRLNVKDGYWNFAKQLYIGSSVSEDQKQKVWGNFSKISPIITALSMALARTIEGNMQIVATAITLYMLGYIVLWGYAKHLAISFELKKWEADYNIHIEI